MGEEPEIRDLPREKRLEIALGGLIAAVERFAESDRDSRRAAAVASVRASELHDCLEDARDAIALEF